MKRSSTVSRSGNNTNRLFQSGSHPINTLIRRPWSFKVHKTPPMDYWDVFINHRGPDTKRTIGGLLYNQLQWMGLHPFLDTKSMKPGDLLNKTINSAIEACKVGIVVFSPTYCKSCYCLDELALMVESNKKIIPIFCDVKPFELHIDDVDGISSAAELTRFKEALKLAKDTVGLTFDSSKGDWAQFLTSVAEIVVQSLIEVDQTTYYAHRG